MADFYPYLVASLPTLHFGMKPPFSYEQFLELCRRFIPTKDYHYLTILPPPVQYTEKAKRPVIIEKWIRFDSALRNELVKYGQNGGRGMHSHTPVTADILVLHLPRILRQQP